MALLPVRELQLSQFHWDPTLRTLTAEASDLAGTSLFQRLWDDACDEGFAVRSHYTNHLERFVYTEEYRNKDGDVTMWKFTPAVKRPGLKVRAIYVYND